MADNRSQSLLKLVIHSFEEHDFKEEDVNKKFTTPINPETFTKTCHIELDTARGHGQPGTKPKYKSTAPEELKIEFVLDGTKTMEGYAAEYKTMDVSKQIKKFTDCVYQYKGDIHRPRFLIVIWGSEVRFPCVLSHMDLNYSLFKPNGDPLRVKISATFVKCEIKDADVALLRPQSTDLTHYRVVKQGDRVDLLTYNIYKDSGYFLQVARSNGLSTVRNIRPGTEMYFPPMNKNEE